MASDIALLQTISYPNAQAGFVRPQYNVQAKAQIDTRLSIFAGKRGLDRCNRLTEEQCGMAEEHGTCSLTRGGTLLAESTTHGRHRNLSTEDNEEFPLLVGTAHKAREAELRNAEASQPSQPNCQTCRN